MEQIQNGDSVESVVTKVNQMIDVSNDMATEVLPYHEQTSNVYVGQIGSGVRTSLNSAITDIDDAFYIITTSGIGYGYEFSTIGDPGEEGFGVGVCPTPPAGYTPMAGYDDPSSDNYGTYQYTDGSVMVWVPAFYFRLGHPDNPTYESYGDNSIDIKPVGAFSDEASANASGYYLHQAFVNGGDELPGFFRDKYDYALNGDEADAMARVNEAYTQAAISQLLPAGAGRVAAIYTNPAKPSYDECIQKNMDALGPELVVNGGFDDGLEGWDQSTASWSAASGYAVSNGANGRLYQTVPDLLGKMVAVKFTVVDPGTVGNLGVSLSGGGATYTYPHAQLSAGQTVSVAGLKTVNNEVSWFTSSGWNGAIDDVSIREFDLSKCVLFADAAGQTPVVYPIRAGQGKGLLLDRSAGLVRGVNIIGPVWAVSGVWAQDGSDLISTATTNTRAIANLTEPLKPATWYEIEYEIKEYTSGNVRLRMLTGGTAVTTPSQNSVGVKRVGCFYNDANTVVDFEPSFSIGFVGRIGNISVREIPGHHQQQPTAAARGEFSRRYNLLTATETFESAVWSNSGATIAANAIAAPKGTGMAVKAVESDRHSEHRVGSMVTKPAFAQQYIASVYVKAAERTGFGLYVIETGVFANRALCIVDLNTGTVTSVSSAGTFSGASCTVTDAGNGWFKVELQFTSGAETTLALRGYIGNGTTLSYEGDGTSGIYIWGADLRLSADAIPSIPAYQRVTTASDYDEVGFPTYWRAQTDDWAKSHMNPNGATKAYVFWAGQKMSDAGSQTVIETSANADTTAGTLGILFGIGANRYLGFSRGTIGPVSASVSGAQFDGVSRGAVTIAADIPSDFLKTSVNGTTATSAQDQGTGAYTEQDVFFGARAGTSLFANIREYAPPTILFLQSADSLSASHLSKLQRGYAKAVGVTL